MTTTTGSALKILLVIDTDWCLAGETHEKLLRSKSAIVLSDRKSRIAHPSKQVTVKFRSLEGVITLDEDANLRIAEGSGKVTLQSAKLAAEVVKHRSPGSLIFLHLEQVDEVLRVTVQFSGKTFLADLEQERPELRLSVHGLPPLTVTEVEPPIAESGMEGESVYWALVERMQSADERLFAVHTERFLRAPHIVVPLLSHLASLTAEDNLRFPVQLKRLSDQFRTILETPDSPLRIRRIARNHLDTWADAQGKVYTFVDGGVAKIAGLPGTEPTALRIGVYSVRAGDVSPNREKWELHPYVVGDIIDKNTGVPMNEGDRIDLRRLGEAARYTLEPLTALRFAERNADVEAFFLHGPLINQFTQYDEIEPNYLPFLREDFLAGAGITRSHVEELVRDIPPRDGKKMWRQFMAIYGYISLRVSSFERPFVGVVERSAGSWIAEAVLDAAVQARIVNESYKKKVMRLLAQYSVSDDFLFGCVLEEGEYISPVKIPKNAPRRARDSWQPVVQQYPSPFATVLKTADTTFPFRVELNEAGSKEAETVMRLLYHTARLLPRYAFPVGLDIVDKYAKVPDWLSKNISARLAAAVLNRAMAEGDARLVTQIRRLLAHTPRDFFYRPQAY